MKIPSVYCLEQAGNQFLSLVNQLREKNDKFEPLLYSLKIDLEIYLADLGGELQHDYDKGNKRYKGKWSTEKSKLVGFISKFKRKILENKMTEFKHGATKN